MGHSGGCGEAVDLQHLKGTPALWADVSSLELNVTGEPFTALKCRCLLKAGLKQHCEGRGVVVCPGGSPSEASFPKDLLSVG